jgi:hypothetical protein
MWWSTGAPQASHKNFGFMLRGLDRHISILAHSSKML